MQYVPDHALTVAAFKIPQIPRMMNGESNVEVYSWEKTIREIKPVARELYEQWAASGGTAIGLDTCSYIVSVQAPYTPDNLREAVLQMLKNGDINQEEYLEIMSMDLDEIIYDYEIFFNDILLPLNDVRVFREWILRLGFKEITGKPAGCEDNSYFFYEEKGRPSCMLICGKEIALLRLVIHAALTPDYCMATWGRLLEQNLRSGGMKQYSVYKDFVADMGDVSWVQLDKNYIMSGYKAENHIARLVLRKDDDDDEYSSSVFGDVEDILSASEPSYMEGLAPLDTEILRYGVKDADFFVLNRASFLKSCDEDEFFSEYGFTVFKEIVDTNVWNLYKTNCCAKYDGSYVSIMKKGVTLEQLLPLLEKRVENYHVEEIVEETMVDPEDLMIQDSSVQNRGDVTSPVIDEILRAAVEEDDSYGGYKEYLTMERDSRLGTEWITIKRWMQWDGDSKAFLENEYYCAFRDGYSLVTDSKEVLVHYVAQFPEEVDSVWVKRAENAAVLASGFSFFRSIVSSGLGYENPYYSRAFFVIDGKSKRWEGVRVSGEFFNCLSSIPAFFQTVKNPNYSKPSKRKYKKNGYDDGDWLY